MHLSRALSGSSSQPSEELGELLSRWIMCKGPEAGEHLVFILGGKKASVAKEVCVRLRMGGSEVVGLGGDYRALQAVALFRNASWLKAHFE